MTLIVSIIVAYCFVHRKNDERNVIKLAERIIEDIRQSILSEALADISNKQKNLQSQRQITNNIFILEKILKKLKIDVELYKYIDLQFDEFKEIIGEYISGNNIPDTDRRHLIKIANNIANKCNLIIFIEKYLFL